MAIGLDLEERQLISQLKQGNTDAAGTLMDLHGEVLMRYLYSIMGTREAAEDVFQDSWVKVMEKINLFNTEMSFKPWLFRIARNVAYDTLRRKKRWWSLDTGRSTESGEQPMEIPDPTDFGHQVVARETVKRLLGSLAPAYREVLCLRFFQDQSYEEIAEFCRLPLGTVKSRLKRGLDYLASNMMEGENHG
jgi:RNA polymerase sigma-70 factor (ECF subfamily)